MCITTPRYDSVYMEGIKMIIYKTIHTNVKIIDAIQCDKCKTKIFQNNVLEMQEMLRWVNYCGYGSAFGDGVTVSIDLCQRCVKELLGLYLYKHPV